jgi:hypothetical protein
MSPPIDPIDFLIRTQLIEYHDIFKSRGDVLDHMFFVLGSGYGWKDGGLVEKVPELPLEPNWDMFPGQRERHFLSKEEARRQINARATDVTIACPYPICEGVPFFEVPDNVQLPYLKAALEIGSLRLMMKPDDLVKVQLENLFGMLKARQ